MAGDPLLAATDSADAYVADLLPATALQPEPARQIGFFKAFCGYWIMPGRLGPHLAVDRMRRALGAHALAVLVPAFVSVVLWGVSQLRIADEYDADWGPREGVAHAVLQTARDSAFAPVPWIAPLLILGAVPLIELALIALGTLLMPWCADGDRASSVWKRSVKNVYWSTTVLPWALLVGLLVSWLLTDALHTNHLQVLMVIVVACGLPVLLVRMWLVGAKRYVGEPDGPAFRPREPRCDDCGYSLIRLPVEGRCPECGLPVRESLPNGRRRPTPWQEHELRPRGFRELLRLQRVLLWDRSFFKRLPVHSGIAAARHFWWGTYALMIVGVLVIVKVAQLLSATWSAVDLGVASVAVLLIAALFVVQAAVSFIACLLAQFHYGVSDYRVSATVCYYASPMMWPVALLAATAAAVGLWLTELTDARETPDWLAWSVFGLAVVLGGLAVGAG